MNFLQQLETIDDGWDTKKSTKHFDTTICHASLPVLSKQREYYGSVANGVKMRLQTVMQSSIDVKINYLVGKTEQKQMII